MSSSTAWMSTSPLSGQARLVWLHVDPLTIRSKCVIDATGHDAEVCNIVVRKMGRHLCTSTGGIDGEKPMWAEVAERGTVDCTREVCSGLFVAGMSANAVFGLPRMGPIFGGMLLSGERVAALVSAKLCGPTVTDGVASA